MKKIKTIKGIALELCRREAGKKQVDVAQMTEIVAHLSDMIIEMEFEMRTLSDILLKNGTSRKLRRDKGKVRK